jgi:hypothetical protein
MTQSVEPGSWPGASIVRRWSMAYAAAAIARFAHSR